jgi:hypothetical protein
MRLFKAKYASKTTDLESFQLRLPKVDNRAKHSMVSERQVAIGHTE